jgi:hypothetical protein
MTATEPCVSREKNRTEAYQGDVGMANRIVQNCGQATARESSRKVWGLKDDALLFVFNFRCCSGVPLGLLH